MDENYAFETGGDALEHLKQLAVTDPSWWKRFIQTPSEASPRHGAVPRDVQGVYGPPAAPPAMESNSTDLLDQLLMTHGSRDDIIPELDLPQTFAGRRPEEPPDTRVRGAGPVSPSPTKPAAPRPSPVAPSPSTAMSDEGRYGFQIQRMREREGQARPTAAARGYNTPDERSQYVSEPKAGPQGEFKADRGRGAVGSSFAATGAPMPPQMGAGDKIAAQLGYDDPSGNLAMFKDLLRIFGVGR